MKKQTAIKWLINELENNGIKHIDLCEEIINKAKAMEKEQMKGMYIEGAFAQRRFFDGKEFIIAEQHYNETFGGDE